LGDWIQNEDDLKQHIAREKLKARKLRNSQWWKNRIAKGICYYCQKQFAPEDLTMDHIVPLSRGGHSTKGNVVPCCKPCNSRKKTLTPTEMILNKGDEEAPKDIPGDDEMEHGS
jgi:5-methylcytosine-specific restriction endonuclease McrA